MSIHQTRCLVWPIPPRQERSLALRPLLESGHETNGHKGQDKQTNAQGRARPAAALNTASCSAAQATELAYNITHTTRCFIQVRHPWLIAGLAYALGAVIFLWPMPAQMGHAIWGDRFDAWTTLWLIDHLAVRMTALNFSAQTTEILFPIGYNLWSFGHLALQAIGGAMVALGLPLVASYNLLLLLGIWTSALAAHALGRELTGSHLAGGLCGIVFASTPYLYAEAGAGCIELVAAGLLPLHALCLVRLMRRPSLRRMGVAAAVLAVIGPFNWYYTLFAGLFAVAFVIWQAFSVGPRALNTPRRKTERRGLGLVVVSLLIAGAIDAPLIMEARRETPSRPSISADLFSSETAFEEVRDVSNGATPIAELTTEKLARVDAMQVHFNSTSVAALLKAKFESNPLYSTPGRLAFMAGLFGLFVAGRRTWGWMAIGTGATILTLGPFLNVSGALLLSEGTSHLPLPYYWAHEYLPFFSKAYRPYRIGVITAMCMAASGAIGAAAWIRSSRLPPFQWPLLLVGLLGFSQPHWSGDRPANRPLADTRVDAAYSSLAELGPGGVIELPLLYQPVSSANAVTQFHQTIHRHPVLNSNQLIRWPDLLRFKEHVAANALLRTVVDIGRKPPPYSTTSADIMDLQEQGYRWIIARREVKSDATRLSGDRVHVDLLDAPAWRFLAQTFGQPAIDTGAVVIWDMSVANTEQLSAIHETGEGITPLKFIFDPVSTGFPLALRPGQSTQIFEGTASQFNAWIHPLSENAALSLRIESGGIVREVPLDLVTEHWRYNSITTDPSENLRLSLVGRGDTPSEVEITRASVSR